MSFWIQTGNPALLDVDEIAQEMSDAIALVYPDDTEYLILSWNRVPVIVNYCDDFHVFVYQIVELLEKLQDPDFTEAELCTGASDFFAEWWIRRDGDELVIESRWRSIVGSYEFLLNERSRLTVKADDFTTEWLKVLRRVVEDITAKAVRMEDDDLFVRAKALVVAADARGEA